MEKNPFISVLMPIRNEASTIEQSLHAVLTQDYPWDRIEVVVADGMSTDNTREIVRSLQVEQPILHLVDNPGKIVSTGLNAAISLAVGDILVRVDGHTIIAKDYLHECVSALQRSEADNVGGRMTPSSASLFGRGVALATTSPFGVGGSRFHYSETEEWVDTVYLGAWPRDVFRRVGLFDPEQVRNQDDEFNYRLRSLGGKVLLSPRIKSQYHNRSTPRSLWRQYFQYGLWKVRVMQKHPRQMQPRQFVPSLFVLVLLMSVLTAPFLSMSRWVSLAAGSAYLLATILATFLRGRRQTWAERGVLPLAFMILHVSYGFGFLLGLLKFWKKWVKPSLTQIAPVSN